MEYEYEKENKEAVMINTPKANRELQEVYRKAKAWATARGRGVSGASQRRSRMIL